MFLLQNYRIFVRNANDNIRSWIESTIDAHALSMMSPSFVSRSSDTLV